MKFVRIEEEVICVTDGHTTSAYHIDGGCAPGYYQEIADCIPQEELVKALLLQYPVAIRIREYMK